MKLSGIPLPRDKRLKILYFFDSSCQQWVHHGCAGLSKSRFAQLSKSRDPFLCQQCRLMLLEETIAKLTKEVELLKSHRCEAAPSLSTSSTPQTDYIHCNTCVDATVCSSYSDHHLVTTTIKSNHHRGPDSTPRHIFIFFAKAGTGSQNHHTLSADLIPLPLLPYIDQMWSFFKSIITNACNLFIPKVNFQSCQSPKLFNAKIRHHLHEVHSQRCLTKSYSTQSRLNKLSVMESRLLQLMQSTKHGASSTNTTILCFAQ